MTDEEALPWLLGMLGESRRDDQRARGLLANRPTEITEALDLAVHALRARGPLVEALEAAEWAVSIRGYGYACPACGGGKDDGGHAENCGLAAALALAKERP